MRYKHLSGRLLSIVVDGRMPFRLTLNYQIWGCFIQGRLALIHLINVTGSPL